MVRGLLSAALGGICGCCARARAIGQPPRSVLERLSVCRVREAGRVPRLRMRSACDGAARPVLRGLVSARRLGLEADARAHLQRVRHLRGVIDEGFSFCGVRSGGASSARGEDAMLIRRRVSRRVLRGLVSAPPCGDWRSMRASTAAVWVGRCGAVDVEPRGGGHLSEGAPGCAFVDARDRVVASQRVRAAGFRGWRQARGALFEDSPHVWRGPARGVLASLDGRVRGATRRG
jgi:hypothetical protein